MDFTLVETSIEDLLEFVNSVNAVPLKSLTEPAAFEPLIALLHSSILYTDADTDEQCRVVIADYLLRFGSKAIKPLIDYILHEPEGDYINQIFKSPDVPEHLRDISRSAIAYLIAARADESVAGDLLALFNTMDRRYPMQAIARAAIILQPEPAIEKLTDLMLDHKDPYVRREIVGILGQHAHHDVLQALILMIKDEAAFVAKAAIQQFAFIKSPHALPFLIEAMTDFREIEVRVVEDGSVAMAAVRTMIAYQTPSANNVLFDWCVEHLYSSDIGILNRAIEILEILADQRALPHLEKALNSGHMNHMSHVYGFRKRIYDAIDAIKNQSAK